MDIDAYGLYQRLISKSDTFEPYYDTKKDDSLQSKGEWLKSEFEARQRDYLSHLEETIYFLQEQLDWERSKPPVRVNIPEEMKKLERAKENNEKQIKNLKSEVARLEAQIKKEKENAVLAVNTKNRIEEQYQTVFDNQAKRENTLEQELKEERQKVLVLTDEIARLKKIGYFPDETKKKKRKQQENVRFTMIEV